MSLMLLIREVCFGCSGAGAAGGSGRKITKKQMQPAATKGLKPA